jgi:hypothetical protein
MSDLAPDSIAPARPLLFQEFKLRGLTLKNRLVVPPMVHYRAAPGSTCGIFHNVHLGRYRWEVLGWCLSRPPPSKRSA